MKIDNNQTDSNLLNRIVAVQVSDTTGGDSSNAAQYIRVKPKLLIPIAIGTFWPLKPILAIINFD